jgi:hypothetical protein
MNNKREFLEGTIGEQQPLAGKGRAVRLLLLFVVVVMRSNDPLKWRWEKTNK